jgi:vacuolar-type H+-ATPase subunit E/Vma4
MALQDILAAMEADVGGEIKRLLAEADTTAARVKADAEQEAQAIRRRLHAEAFAPLHRERARRLNQARRDARNAAGQAHEALVEEAIRAARGRLSTCRSDPAYPGVLRVLVAEALEGVEGSAVLHADPRDAALLRAFAPDVPAEWTLETWGGVEARSADGRVVVVNTLEARLDQARPLIRQQVLPHFTREE